MGREARRTHKDFSWPLKRTWAGYTLPSITCFVCLGNSDGCITCEGEGELWPRVDPPSYPVDNLPRWFRLDFVAEEYGWQMWETTSEGSPISPIFDTPEELARWLADTNASAFGSTGASYEAWLSTIHRGGAVSAVLSNDGNLRSGVEANLDLDKD